jgi:hypothetical protein
VVFSRRRAAAARAGLSQGRIGVLVGGEVGLDFGLRLWHLLGPVGVGPMAHVQPASDRRAELRYFSTWGYGDTPASVPAGGVQDLVEK